MINKKLNLILAPASLYFSDFTNPMLIAKDTPKVLPIKYMRGPSNEIPWY